MFRLSTERKANKGVSQMNEPAEILCEHDFVEVYSNLCINGKRISVSECVHCTLAEFEVKSNDDDDD
jgi:hypothetical protein